MPRRIGFGLMCTLVVVSGLWFVAAGGRRVTVSLTVESETRMVSTAAPTVGRLLSEERIALRPADLVVPPTTVPVTDGLRVEVRRARDLILVVDGHKQARSIVARTVGEAVKQWGFGVPEGSILDPPAKAVVLDGMRISLRRPSTVILRHDDYQDVAVTTASTIQDLLADKGIALAVGDVVEPGLRILPEQGVVVTVNRSGTHEYTTRDIVPAPLEVREAPDLPVGQEIIVEPGKEGVIDRIYRTTVIDGALMSRVVVKEIVIDKPQPRVIARGTKPAALPPPPPQQAPGAGPEPAPAPPAPEVRSDEGVASWYHRAGMTAAHQSLPFGTEVKVTNLGTGQSIYVTVDDRGPYVDGRVIDLSDGAFEALAPLGAGVISVRIDW